MFGKKPLTEAGTVGQHLKGRWPGGQVGKAQNGPADPTRPGVQGGGIECPHRPGKHKEVVFFQKLGRQCLCLLACLSV